MNKLFKTTRINLSFVLIFLFFISVMSLVSYAEEKGWCCKDGYVYNITKDECTEKGGKFFLTEKEAIKYCTYEDPGWCCYNGSVYASTPEICKEKGGVYFPTEVEAKKYCDEGEGAGWCCLDGMVFAATPEVCKKKGGVYFPTEAAAIKYCEEDSIGWCCFDGVVFPATPEECKKKGGAYFPTKPAAEKYCEYRSKLPDLQVVNIFLNKKCQVVVKVMNNGPGFVPDSVWTVHFPKSSSVYIYINGKKWGGRTIWKFDPGKSLKTTGGTALYTSSLIVKTSAKITATIDHTLQVAEANETNNKLGKYVKCRLKMLKQRRLK